MNKTDICEVWKYWQFSAHEVNFAENVVAWISFKVHYALRKRDNQKQGSLWFLVFGSTWLVAVPSASDFKGNPCNYILLTTYITLQKIPTLA